MQIQSHTVSAIPINCTANTKDRYENYSLLARERADLLPTRGASTWRKTPDVLETNKKENNQGSISSVTNQPQLFSYWTYHELLSRKKEPFSKRI